MMSIVSVMEKLTKDDLAQMNRVYFKKFDQKAACRLLDFSVHLVERLEQDSKNSSKPPSSDNPYDKKTTRILNRQIMRMRLMRKRTMLKKTARIRMRLSALPGADSS